MSTPTKVLVFYFAFIVAYWLVYLSLVPTFFVLYWLAGWH